MAFRIITFAPSMKITRAVYGSAHSEAESISSKTADFLPTLHRKALTTQRHLYAKRATAASVLHPWAASHDSKMDRRLSIQQKTVSRTIRYCRSFRHETAASGSALRPEGSISSRTESSPLTLLKTVSPTAF